MKRYKIGTRGSKLALAQAMFVSDRLKAGFTNFELESVTIKTKADRFSTRPLRLIEGEGLFTKEIEGALLDGRIDLGVHSLKDLPLDIREGLEIAAVLKRDDPRDVLVSKDTTTLIQMKKGAKLGTSSLRRSSQVLKIRPDLKIEPLRGNIDTRIGKVKGEDRLDAIIVSACGLKRLGLEKEITEYLDFDTMLPCVGQGVVAIETRSADYEIKKMARSLHDEDTFLEIQAERSFLKRLGGGCRTPVGAIAEVKGDTLSLRGIVLSPDGKTAVRAEFCDKKQDALNIGTGLADTLINKGADKLLLCS